MVVRDEIKNILLKIGAGADDEVDLVPPDHLGERDTELGGRHRPCDGHQHFPACGEMHLVTLWRIEKRRSVEVAIIRRDEFGDRTFLCRECSVDLFWSAGGPF